MEASWVIEGVIILVLLLFSAFFSASETALTAVSRARIFHLIKEGDKRAQRVERLRELKDRLIGAILLGNNMVNIAAASLATTLAIGWFGVEMGPLYATVVMTVVVLIFSEVLPKTIAIHNAERVALAVVYPLSFVIRLLMPVTALVQWLIRIMLRMIGVNPEKSSFVSASDMIRGTIELHHSEGEVEKQDRDMLGSILDLSEREISEVMIHRKQVDAIDMALEPDAIVDAAMKSMHSRIPLYKDSPDNIIGILHIKDVLRLVMSRKSGITREMIRRIAGKPWFVPDTTSLDDQLFAFRHRRKHFACVVDEYGAFLGIVTLEDIIEEIVGDIDDEHDALEIDDIIPYDTNAYRVEGTVTIRDLNRHLDWSLPDEHAATVAGLVLHEAELIPEEGAVFEFFNMRFTIAQRVGNQLTQLIIEPLLEEDEDA